MSERMIEIQRQKILQGKGASSGSGTAHPPARQQSPQYAAATRMATHDLHLQHFLQRLNSHEPTTPTALTRRVLHQHGVGFADPHVAAIVSAAADRFLVNVLQQANVCREQRLQGMEDSNNFARKRKRHMDHHQNHKANQLRKQSHDEHARTKANQQAIRRAEDLQKAAAAAAAGPTDDNESTTSRKKKRPDTMNGQRLQHPLEDDDQEPEYDSLDEEEEYYRSKLGDPTDVDDEAGVDDLTEAMNIRDMARPLRAWDFSVTGKAGMEMIVDDDHPSDDEESEAEDQDEAMDDEDDEERDGDEEENEDEDDPATRSPASKKATAATSSPP